MGLDPGRRRQFAGGEADRGADRDHRGERERDVRPAEPMDDGEAIAGEEVRRESNVGSDLGLGLDFDFDDAIHCLALLQGLDALTNLSRAVVHDDVVGPEALCDRGLLSRAHGRGDPRCPEQARELYCVSAYRPCPR